jgi:hypothetical protein
MMRTVLSALCVCAIATLGLSTIAVAEKPPAREFIPSDGSNPALNLSQPLVFKQGGDTVWLQVYTGDDACTCDPAHGSECDGGPDGTETFCFEKYNPNTADSLYKYYGSPGTPYFAPETGNGFWTTDARKLGSPSGLDFWHLDTYQAFEGTSWWCGALDGGRCADWDNAPGYGDAWNQLLVLDPDIPGAGTVKLDCWVRYDTECDYDYAYIQYSNDAGATWETLAQFNACSGNTGVPTCGADYYGFGALGQGNPPGGNVSWVNFPYDATTMTGDPTGGDITVTDAANFRLGFKFESDGAWSDKDGRGNTDGAIFVDYIQIFADDGTTVLEFEDMDDEFESAKWGMQAPPGIANHWWMPFDPDPPNEPEEGADICDVNASWVWCGCPFVSNKWRVPPESNGFLYRLVGPTIYTGWGEPDVPKEYAGLVVQRDIFVCFKENFCDYYDTKVTVYNTAPSTGQPAGWCGWENIDGYIYYGGCDFMNVDSQEDVSQWMGSAIDSVMYAWDMMDVGATDDWCWTTTTPKPHRKSTMQVDNISFGLFDASGTFFHARVIDMLQDTFDLETAAHNALCANADMPKILVRSESLYVDIHDMNGLTGTNAYVRLYFSTDQGGTWDFNDMVLAVPDDNNPDLGGSYIGSIHPSEIDITPYPNATWIPGTEVWYYIEARDDLLNLAWWPDDADPSNDPPTRPYYNNYWEFSILPGTGEAYEEPNRILLVDDFGRNDYDYHPCMEESVVVAAENFYESILYDLGYCYDKYDVQGASTGLSNEPWDLVTYPDPANPDSLERRYDAVIWFTSRFDQYTVLDTMQCRLVDFVRKGGHLFVAGNLLGVDMTNYGLYDDAAAETCEFYGGLLGAKMEEPGDSQLGIKNPHLYAKGSGLVAGSALTTADKFHFHLGCPISVPHDLTRLNDSPPTWAPSPTPYLIYEDGYAAGDTLVAIYNEYTDGGKVVHMCFDLTAMVDSSAVSCAKADYKGRIDLMTDILGNLFGLVPLCPHYGAVDDFIPSSNHLYSLKQNYPNPFNPDTDIQFSIREGGRVSLKVYNVRGQVVKTLVDRSMQAGQYTAHWDGTNDNGQLVSSGIYFCKMEANDFGATKKMILLK